MKNPRNLSFITLGHDGALCRYCIPLLHHKKTLAHYIIRWQGHLESPTNIESRIRRFPVVIVFIWLKQYLFAQRLPPDFMVMTFSQLLSPLHHMPLGIWDSLMILPMGVCGWLKKHVPGPLPIIVFSTIAIIFLQLFGDGYFLDIEEEMVTGFQKQKKNF